MFKTKSEVDRHVDNCMKKINNETERNLRCFSFAKLYYNVGDYEHASRYIKSYLSAKPKSAEGQLWLGKCLEKLGKNQAALEAYRNSLQIDPKQNNLIIKVCELLSPDDVNIDKSEARYYCNLAQTIDPTNPIVYTLKERLITVENEDPQEVTKLLLKELTDRPNDINLWVRLLKHFLQHNMIKEAYKHASDLENRSLVNCQKHLTWYETVAEVLVRFERDRSLASQLTWEFWFLSVSVLDRLVALSLDEHMENVKNNTECVTAAFNFDQMLSKASQNISSCLDRQLVTLFLNHYHAQLYFHIATLLFKQAKRDLIRFKEASNISLPVLLAAYHTPPPDLQSLWLIHCSENIRQLVLRWHKEASFRCSQVAHILIAAASDRKSVLIEKATQYSTGIWRDQLFKKVFVQRDQQLKMSTSYFVSSPTPLEPAIKLPDPDDVVKYDEAAQLMYPDSLHYYIWMAKNSDLSQFNVKTFDGLQYSIKNLNNCAAESINILDIQAFVYCTTLCAMSKLDENKHNMYFSQDRPKVLPAYLTECLGTLNQSKFFSAVYKMHKNIMSSDVSELRLLLIKGIEVVRCIGHHGLNVKVLVHLADIFEKRAKASTKQSEIEFNYARAELYWKAALPLLEKIKNNQVITYPNNRLFELRGRELNVYEASAHIAEGKLFFGTQLMKKKDYDRALQIFEQLKDPYASYYQSQIYKLMADQKTNENREYVTSEMRSQNYILLSKARDCLYLTLDRLREPSVDRNHPLNAQLGSEIEKMERMLSRIDPDCNNRNECDGMSDENGTSDNSVGEQFHSFNKEPYQSFHNTTAYTPKQDVHNHSTPLRFSIQRQEARPSPERLDAQIRQMAATRDVALNSVLEQNKMLAESHKTLVEELRSFKDAIKSLTAVVKERRNPDDLSEFKKTVEELKNSVDELHNVGDVVKEMRKEINELKKDQNKNNQLSDEDLFVLDPDYGVDYNINSNMNTYGTNFPNVYPNYPPPPRMTNANALAAYGPPGLYPGLYPNLAYAYGGLALPQPGTLPFSAEMPVPGLPAPISGAYPPPLMSQPPPPINPALTNPNLGVGMLTGQALSQTTTQPSIREPTKPSAATITSTTASISAPFSSASVSKAPPVNVVITNSDPLPTNKTSTSHPVLSVTIPPHHIKGSTPKSQPHNYQIPMPSSVITTVATTPAILSKPPPAISTQSLLSNIAPPLFSAVNQNKSKNVSLGLQIEKTLDETFNNDRTNTSNVSNVSASSVEEHDPCPDFKPIIPLPDEVPVNTGEENEQELFCERAKLFRWAVSNDTSEWKERGVGFIKILSNPATGKVRILMRRDQVHKICANHFIDKTMTLIPMKNNERAYFWVAHDYADEKVVIEKLSVRFKTAVEAKKFFDAFEAAKKLLDKAPQVTYKKEPINLSTPKDVKKFGSVEAASTPPATSTTTLGGFVFTSTPTFKPKEGEMGPKPVKIEEPPKGSPFANFTFGKTTTSSTPVLSTSIFKPSEPQTFSPLVISQESANQNNDDSHAEDFVPTAEFKPVVALPDLVEVITGEENSEVLFEARAKLFRYDQSGEVKEWKERGLGVMKVLKDETIRLLMRRDQVLKVCCNHQVLKNMTFKMNSTNAKAVVWSCQDFSDGVLTPETFTVRFKTEDLANQFLQTIQSAQTSLDGDNKISGKHHKPESRPRTTSFGDKFKPPKGNWECKTCYVSNEAKASNCVACDSPKTGTTGKKSEESGALFSFGAIKTESGASTGFVFGQSSTNTAPQWGGSTFTKDNTASKVETSNQPVSFKFIPPEAKKEETKPAAVKGFGDAFKPKAGSWECNMCLIRNDHDKLYCASCDTPKDDTVPKKDANKGVNLDTGGQKFTFGIPQATPAVKPNVSAPTVTFSSNVENKPLSIFKPPTSNQFSFKAETAPTTDSQFVFGSPQKHEFEFKPRSPRRASGGQGDEGAESDASYVEEEEDTTYFKPVIPLPDKIQVVTGEEDEEVVYCHRAKLFRFVDSEWKERGLGDVKILRNKISGKLRVLMRREQVLKICLNHALTKDVDYLPKDEKSWLFHVADFSEGQFAHEQFCLRFKNGDIAQEFKEAVSQALSGTSAGGHGDQGSAVVSIKKEDSDDEVVLVSETAVSAEDEREAVRLKLPPKFMSYKQLPDCSCDQCSKDDEYLKELFTDAKKPTFSFMGTPARSSTTTSFGTPLTNSSVFGTPTGSAFALTPTTGQSDQKSAIIKPSKLGTSPPTDIQKTETPAAHKTFSFGMPVANTTSTTPSIFGGGTNLFGTTPAKAETTVSNIFGTPSTPVKPVTTTTNIFALSNNSTAGTPATNASNIFGTPTPATKPVSTTSNIFSMGSSSTVGTPAKAEATASNIFATSAKPVSTTGNIFGTGSTSVTTAGIFSGTNSNTTGSIFGGSTNTSTTGSIFGTILFGTGLNFGTSKSEPPKSANPIFGGAAVSSASSTPATTPSSVSTTNSIFSAPAIGGTDVSSAPTTPSSVSTAKSIFSAPAFGASAAVTQQPLTQSQGLFGGWKVTDNKVSSTTNLKEGDEVVLKTNSFQAVSFADLAASPDAKPAFSKTGDGNFAFLGAGAPVFGATSKATNKNQSKSKNESDDENNTSGAQAEEEYDPHYEPIVPLPEAIVVSTGEEEEVPVFNERAKLYRYDASTKEWKERGVGQIKVLHHKENDTYRLLLRREQVHKIVLNQLIVPTLELQPMMSSDKAWMWAGYNYTDDENNLEQLAIRFKNTELAQQFHDVVTDVVKRVMQIQNDRSLPASVQNYGVEDISGDEENNEEDGNEESVEDEEDEGDDDDYDEDDRSVTFSKRCTLSQLTGDNRWISLGIGDLQVYYDSDMYTYRISVTKDSKSCISNTLIAMNTLMNIDRNECTWKAVEWAEPVPEWRNLKATFSSESAAQEFHSNYLEGLTFAQQANIMDELPQISEVETED